MNKRLAEIAESVLAEQIEKILQTPADSDVAKANHHLLEYRGTEPNADGFGMAAGELSCVGVFFYALDCTLIVTGSQSCAVTFNAIGFSWDVGAFTAQVVGTWLVDPKTVAGKCHFTCVVVDVGEGAVSLTLYSEHGQLYGTFAGDTEGGDIADISGTGTLTVS